MPGNSAPVTLSCGMRRAGGKARLERVPHWCLCGSVWSRAKSEILLSGVTPDPARPVSTQDALARLRLAQALQRARIAIAWERGWPHLARLLTVIGLFLVASWAGLWLALPFTGRVIGVGLFGA